MQGNRAKGMAVESVKFWSPPKVKKQSKHNRERGVWGKERMKPDTKDKVQIKQTNKKKNNNIQIKNQVRFFLNCSKLYR